MPSSTLDEIYFYRKKWKRNVKLATYVYVWFFFFLSLSLFLFPFSLLLFERSYFHKVMDLCWQTFIKLFHKPTVSCAFSLYVKCYISGFTCLTKSVCFSIMYKNFCKCSKARWCKKSVDLEVRNLLFKIAKQLAHVSKQILYPFSSI